MGQLCGKEQSSYNEDRPSISTRIGKVIHTELDQFNSENNKLRDEIQSLKDVNTKLEKENSSLRNSVRELSFDYAMVLSGSQSNDRLSNKNIIDIYTSELYKSNGS